MTGHRTRKPFRTTSLILSLALCSTAGQAVEIDFGAQILPVLLRRCGACHQGPNAQKGMRVSSVEDLLRGGESGPALVPSDPDASLILSMVEGEKPEMPPLGEPMTAQEIEALRSWIAAGAQFEGSSQMSGPETVWWSLLPLSRAAAPAPAGVWERSPIDGFVLASMVENGLAPSGEADRRTLIRRLSFDLLGLPPSIDEIDAFIGDSAPGAYERLVDRMLSSPAYGERWGRHWLDVARFGESNGYEQNHLRDRAWPYRDWVIGSFNDDKPFNRMIVEQLAGDRIAPGNPRIQAATGFLVAGPHDTVGIENPEGEAQKRANHLDDMIMGTASAFLGLTVHCARCHDHKFDAIRNEDYYRMQAAFAGVWHGERTWDRADVVESYEAAAGKLSKTIRQSEEVLEALREGAKDRIEARRGEFLSQFRPAVDQAGTEETFEPVEARFVKMTITKSTGGRRQVDLDEFAVWSAGPDSRNVALGTVATASSSRVDAARPDTYAPKNLVDGKFDRRWISSSDLPAWIQVELTESHRVDRVAWSSDRLGGFRGSYGRPQPEKYEIEVSVDGRSWTTVATSEGRLPFSEEARELLLLRAVFRQDENRAWDQGEQQRRDAEQSLEQLTKPRRAFLGRFEQPAEPTFVMVRGNPMNKGDEVLPGSLSTLDGLLEGFKLESDTPESERRLALARWIASDRNALTARVIVNRVWMHHFGRPLVRNPSDFGVNGGQPSHPRLLDWLAERLIGSHGWRLKPLHKDIVMSAAYRQTSRFNEASASVDRDSAFLWRFPPRRLGAEELRDAILVTSGNLNRQMGGRGFRLYRYTVDNVATYYPLEQFSRDTYRRSVYHQHARSVKPELLGEFDCPDTSLPAPKRVSTTSPLQALTLLNSAFSLDQADALAERIRKMAGTQRQRQVAVAWQLAYGRDPSDDEAERAGAFTSEHGLRALARAILNSNEFLYVF